MFEEYSDDSEDYVPVVKKSSKRRSRKVFIPKTKEELKNDKEIKKKLTNAYYANRDPKANPVKWETTINLTGDERAHFIYSTGANIGGSPIISFIFVPSDNPDFIAFMQNNPSRRKYNIYKVVIIMTFTDNFGDTVGADNPKFLWNPGACLGGDGYAYNTLSLNKLLHYRTAKPVRKTFISLVPTTVEIRNTAAGNATAILDPSKLNSVPAKQTYMESTGNYYSVDDTTVRYHIAYGCWDNPRFADSKNWSISIHIIGGVK